MVSIFTGLGTGTERGSSNLLGGAGLLGSGSLGRSGGTASLNAATGNLVLQQRDEFLVGKGPDTGVSRTYNSSTTLADDNGDQWRQSTDRRIYGLTGTLNTTGSTIKRVSGDGSEITYSWSAALSKYVTTDGSGAYDTMSVSGSGASSVWTWTDGNTQLRETYAAYDTANPSAPTNWRVATVIDTLGQSVTYTYTGAYLTQLTTADGGTLTYTWDTPNNRVTQITTGYTDYTDLANPVARTLTRTRYGYDTANRLTSVSVDLSPGDNSIADGKTYVTTYTYDGASKRVASVTETDGSSTTFHYDASNRIDTVTQLGTVGIHRELMTAAAR